MRINSDTTIVIEDDDEPYVRLVGDELVITPGAGGEMRLVATIEHALQWAEAIVVGVKRLLR